MSNTKTAQSPTRSARWAELKRQATRDIVRMTDEEHAAFIKRNTMPASSYRQDDPWACLED